MAKGFGFRALGGIRRRGLCSRSLLLASWAARGRRSAGLLTALEDCSS